MISIRHNESCAIISIPDHPGSSIETQAEDYCYLLQALYLGTVWRYSRSTANKVPILIGYSREFGLAMLAEFFAMPEASLRVYPLTSANSHIFEIGALLFASEIGKLAHEQAHDRTTRTLACSRTDCRALVFCHTPGPWGAHTWKSQGEPKVA